MPVGKKWRNEANESPVGGRARNRKPRGQTSTGDAACDRVITEAAVQGESIALRIVAARTRNSEGVSARRQVCGQSSPKSVSRIAHRERPFILVPQRSLNPEIWSRANRVRPQ